MKRLLFLSFVFIFHCKEFGQSLTYANDIAPILNSKCAYCHHSGGIAPFALTDYTLTYTYRFQISNAITNNRMPPWPPDTSYTRFVGERILSFTEKQKILNWIAQGAPSGNLNLAPPTPTFQSTYQLPGTPDLIVKIPTITSSATTQDQYVCISVPSGLTQERYIRAFEIVPGNKAIVHHVILSGDTSGQFPPGIYNNCYTNAKDVGIGGYVPGQGPVVFPSVSPLKMGLRLPPNTNLVFQMHYPAGSYGQTDSTQVRFYFYPQNESGIRPMYVLPLLQNWNLAIPANSVVTYTNTCSPSGLFANCMLPVPISVYGCAPHSHLICKSLVNYAFSGTDTIPLIRINTWDFHWQGFYTFKKMKKIPAFYKWVSKHVYDNTSSNPNNPNNPPQLITAGENTTDEMLFDSFYLTLYQNGDENYNIDSLITVSLHELYKNNSLLMHNINIFPNPASDFCYVLCPPDLKDVTINVYDLMGKNVMYFNAGEQNIIAVPLNHLPDGFYSVEILSGTFRKTFKLLKHNE